MIKGRELVSLPVVTQDDRRQVGEVKDFIYDPVCHKILGYLVENSGWFKDGRGFLHSDVIYREDDCMVIENEQVIKKIGAIPELKEAVGQKKDIRGFRVEEANGHYVGVIQDVVVNGNTGDITGYEISDGIIQDLLDGRITIPNEGINIGCDKVVAIEGAAMDTTMKGEFL